MDRTIWKRICAAIRLADRRVWHMSGKLGMVELDSGRGQIRHGMWGA